MVTGSHHFKSLILLTEIITPGSKTPITLDGIFGIEHSSGHCQLHVMEVHKTTRTKAAANQPRRYLEALEYGLICDRYGYETAPIICSLHEKQNILADAKREFKNLPFFDELKSVFMFNTLKQMELGFSNCRHYAYEKPANYFPKRR